MALGFVAFTACEDDNDSNPTIVQPTAFEIYLQPSIDGNVNLDLEKTTDPIVLSWSQPTPYTDFNAPVVPTYTVQVSPTGSFSTPFDATAEDNTGADFFNINETYTNGKRVEINPQSLNRSLEELAGWTEETTPAVQQVFFRVKSAVRDASFNEYGVIYSNVIALNTVPYYVELTAADPEIWWLIGADIADGSWGGDIGKCVIPMQTMEDEVYDCFTRLIENRKRPMKEPVIEGYSGFLIIDKNDNPTLALHWEHYFQFIRNKYNNHYDIPLPKVTPHVLRHTYCTRKALSGMNPKILQYLMGHSNIEITLGYYTHARYEDAKAELNRLKNCSTETRKSNTVLNFKTSVKTG